MHQCNGTWQLIPELCFYEVGEAPLKCRYHIEVAAEWVQFELSWTQQDGQSLDLHYGGETDSVLREIDNPPGAQASYTVVDQHTLDSSISINGEEVAYARRVVSRDGQLMAVLQVNQQADGVKVRITQVFRRAAPQP